MDKKLLLTIQQECNKQNIPLPWKEIGETMGSMISGGAVVQHLSKLRIRMVAQNLSVPPPLKRGGGIKISTGPSLPRRPAKASQPTTARDATVKKSGKPVNKKRALADMISDDSEEEDFKIDSDSDSDVDYRKPLAKRTRTAATPKHQSPTKRSDDTDSSNDSSKDEAGHEADDNDNRVVAAGADFLTLEDDVPIKKSKVVTLKSGKPIIKQEPFQEQESGSDESDQSGDEAAGGSEDQANQAAHALEAISHINTPAADYAGNTPSQGNSGHPSVSPSSSNGAHTMTNPEYGQLINNSHPAFGGLPTAAGLNIPTFQNPYEVMQYADGHDPRARGQQYHPMPHSDGRYIAYGHDYGHLPNQTFGIAPMSTNGAFSSNLPFHVSNDITQFPYVDHSIPSRSRPFPHQGHQASLPAGAIPLSSIGPPTHNQMPISAEADYFLTSLDRDHHDVGMLSDEDLGQLDYGAYHQRT